MKLKLKSKAGEDTVLKNKYFEVNKFRIGYISYALGLLTAIAANLHLRYELEEIKKPNSVALSFLLEFMYYGTTLHGLMSILGFALSYWEIAGKYLSIIYWILGSALIMLLGTAFVRSIAWYHTNDTERAKDMLFFSKVLYRSTGSLSNDVLVTERKHNCCGIFSFQDYESVFDERRVPDHCCVNHTKSCGFRYLNTPLFYFMTDLYAVDKNYWKKIDVLAKKTKKPGFAKPAEPNIIDTSSRCITPNCLEATIYNMNNEDWATLKDILSITVETENRKEVNRSTIHELKNQLNESLIYHYNVTGALINTTSGNTTACLDFNDVCFGANFNHKVTLVLDNYPDDNFTTTKQKVCRLLYFENGVSSFYRLLVKWDSKIYYNGCLAAHNVHADEIARICLTWSSVQIVIACTIMATYVIYFWQIDERRYFVVHPLPIWYEKLFPGDKCFPRGLANQSHVEYPPYLEPESLEFDTFTYDSQLSLTKEPSMSDVIITDDGTPMDGSVTTINGSATPIIGSATPLNPHDEALPSKITKNKKKLRKVVKNTESESKETESPKPSFSFIKAKGKGVLDKSNNNNNTNNNIGKRLKDTNTTTKDKKSK